MGLFLCWSTLTQFLFFLRYIRLWINAACTGLSWIITFLGIWFFSGQARINMMCSFGMLVWQGQLGPVLTIISDQGLTKAALHILYHMKLRAVWFAGIDHQDHNCDNAVLPAVGLRHASSKALFINRLHRGPKKAPGRWHGKILTAFQVPICEDSNTPALQQKQQYSNDGSVEMQSNT